MKYKTQDSSPDLDRSPSTVAVVGMGKIGLPLAVQYARHGRRVIGCDINPQEVETINAGRSHVQEVPELAAEVAHAISSGLLSAASSTTKAACQAAVVVVLVHVMVEAQHHVNYVAAYPATVP